MVVLLAGRWFLLLLLNSASERLPAEDPVRPVVVHLELRHLLRGFVEIIYIWEMRTMSETMSDETTVIKAPEIGYERALLSL